MALLLLASAGVLRCSAPASVLSALAGRGVIDPTPIQSAVLPRARDGECLLIHSETGSGKTLAYLLPALARAAEPGQQGCVLVLSPTRELAVQIADEADWLIQQGAVAEPGASAGSGFPDSVAAASFGGSAAASRVVVLAPGMPASVDSLLGARVVVATPPELASLLAEPDTREKKMEEKKPSEKKMKGASTRERSSAGGRVGRRGAREEDARGGEWVGGMPPGFLDDAWAEEEGEGEEEEEEVGAGKEAGTGKGARAGKKAGAAEAGVGAVGEGGASIPSDARRLADGLSARVSTLVLDECDAIIPGLKFFRGARLFRWMDAGSFPAEAISKLLLRRTSNPSFQLLAASATLDASTKRKLDRLVRSSPALRAAKRAGTMPVISVKGGGGGADAPAAKAAAVAAASRRVASGEGEEGRERLTLVPPGIEHRVFVLSGVKDGVKDGVKVYVKGGVKGGVNAAAKAARATTGGSIGGGANGAKAKVGGGGNGGGGTAAGTASAAAACVALHASCGGSALVFVSSRSAYLGGAHAVAVELRRLGADALTLSDALFPATTRAVKRLPRSQQAVAAAAAAEAGAGATPAQRRAALNTALGKSPRLLVADAAATRGLHLDSISRVYVLGLPANADTYLHLAGRVGRWPHGREDKASSGNRTPEGGAKSVVSENWGAGDAVVTTLATAVELSQLRGWGKGLGITFGRAELPEAGGAAGGNGAGVAEVGGAGAGGAAAPVVAVEAGAG